MIFFSFVFFTRDRDKQQPKCNPTIFWRFKPENQFHWILKEINKQKYPCFLCSRTSRQSNFLYKYIEISIGLLYRYGGSGSKSILGFHFGVSKGTNVSTSVENNSNHVRTHALIILFEKEIQLLQTRTNAIFTMLINNDMKVICASQTITKLFIYFYYFLKECFPFWCTENLT